MTFPSGLSAFPITPSGRDGRVDAPALRRLVGRLAAAGADSIGLLGSTGTYMYLTRDERRRAIETALDETAGRMPVIVGIGALRTDEAVRLAHMRSHRAAAGLLAPCPTRRWPRRCDRAFRRRRPGRGLPIAIYDNPAPRISASARISSPASPGCPASSPSSPARDRDETLRHLAAQRAALGGVSIGYSVMERHRGNVRRRRCLVQRARGLFPDACLRIVRAAQRGDAAEARRLDAALAPVWDLFRRFSSLRVVHALAELLDICRSEPPRPILPLPDAARREVADVLARLPAGIAG